MPKLTVIDTETTGKKAGIHEIIQLSAVLVDTETWKPVSTFTSLVRPRRTGLIDPEAMGVNQLKLEDLEKAPSSETVRSQFLEWWADLGSEDKINPCGWNYSFDERFLRLLLGEVEYDSLFLYKALDVYSVAFAAQLEGKLPKSLNLGLVDVADHFGLVHFAHNAGGDTYVTWKILKELIK